MVLTELCVNSTMYLHFKASWWLIILAAFLYLTVAHSNESVVSPFMFTCFTSPALHKQGFFYEILAIISMSITLSWFATPEPSHSSNICFAYAVSDKFSRKEVPWCVYFRICCWVSSKWLHGLYFFLFFKVFMLSNYAHYYWLLYRGCGLPCHLGLTQFCFQGQYTLQKFIVP